MKVRCLHKNIFESCICIISILVDLNLTMMSIFCLVYKTTGGAMFFKNKLSTILQLCHSRIKVSKFTDTIVVYIAYLGQKIRENISI